MGDKIMIQEFPDKDQRRSVCETQWNDTNGSKAMPANTLTYRNLSLRKASDGTPETLDEDARSVEVIGATENPVDVFDYEQLRVVPEVLLMSGAKVPKSRQVPLLDSHRRYGTGNVIGSYRDMAFEGSNLVGKAVFSSTADTEDIWTKVREGHLTDFSIGYRVSKSAWVPDGETKTISGREFKGPVRVGTKWEVKELSSVPIGADEAAKARAYDETYNDYAGEPPEGNKEIKPMNEKLRAFLEANGLSKEATEDEANEFLRSFDFSKVKIEENPPPAKPKQEPEPDIDGKVRDAVRVEQQRITEIQAMCRKFDYPEDKARSLIEDSKTVDQARANVLEWLSAQEPEGRGYRGPVEITMDERDKFRAASHDALLLRSGFAVDQPATGADDLTGYSLRELARESLRIANQSVSGRDHEMIGRAFTTSDFPKVLANVASKSLFEGFNSAPETWSLWCDTGNVADLKTNYEVRVSELDDLDRLRENEEYKFSGRSEGQETFRAYKYGKMFGISLETIINDDLNALTDTPRQFGESAARVPGDLAYAVLTSNSNMGDGVSLFSNATHSNYASGASAAVISETTMNLHFQKMRLQKGLAENRRLNIVPQYLIAPVSISGTGEIFFTSNNFTAGTAENVSSTRTNPYAGNRITRVYDPRLDDDSATAYYLAGPKGKTVRVVFLNGQRTPYLEQREGWNTDGTEFKVRFFCGAYPRDWRALQKNDGA